MGTETENTKWLDDIYNEVFDYSMYPTAKMRCRKVRYKIL